MIYFILCHREDNNLAVQLVNHVGLITRLKMESLSKKEWTYIEKKEQGTIFDSEDLADFAKFNFKLPNWIKSRPLQGVEFDLFGVENPDTVPEL